LRETYDIGAVLCSNCSFHCTNGQTDSLIDAERDWFVSAHMQMAASHELCPTCRSLEQRRIPQTYSGLPSASSSRSSIPLSSKTSTWAGRSHPCSGAPLRRGRFAEISRHSCRARPAQKERMVDTNRENEFPLPGGQLVLRCKDHS
jgi:hypothetical protein